LTFFATGAQKPGCFRLYVRMAAPCAKAGAANYDLLAGENLNVNFRAMPILWTPLNGAK
jgi:hypothetical protein